MGTQAGYANTTGVNNVAIGRDTLLANTTGNGNTAVGRNAGDSITTGENNAFLGLRAGHTFTTGSNNVCVGYEAGYQYTSQNNTLWIGRNSGAAHQAGVWIYGDGNGTCHQGNNSTAWTAASDERIKKNIVDSPNGLAKIDAIQVRNFEYRTDEEITSNGLTAVDIVGVQTGVIAQELEAVLPKAVSVSETGLKRINTDPIFWSMVKAIQELSAKNDALETQNATFAARLTALEGE